MTPETRRTHGLFQQLMEQLHKDNEVLSSLLQTYAQNVERLIDLATQLQRRIEQEEKQDDPAEVCTDGPVK